MTNKKSLVLDHRSGALLQHVNVMLDGPPDNFPRYLLSRELDTKKLIFVFRGQAHDKVSVGVNYGTRCRKLDGTIEFVKFGGHQWDDNPPEDLESITSSIVRELETAAKPIDWIEVAAWCNSPLEGNYISVKVTAAENV